VTISTRVREESGFGLVELLIAMTVMAVGITALVAAMSSGFIAVKRAADESTAAAVADKQMEAYHALPNCAIYLDNGTIPTSGAYTTDVAYTGISPAPAPIRVIDNTPLIGTSTCSAATPPELRDAQQPLTGADGHSYSVDTYIVRSTAASGGAAKKVTLVVHDPQNTKVLLRESSTFAPPTGCNNKSSPVSKGC
jgi:prepilin-type N-terminal cleavage/methylation domain-containing protein